MKIGRLQIFNNWSPALVADPDTIWLGLEYFCREGDELWSMKNGRLIEFAADELVKLNLIKRQDVLDGTVVSVPKAYPAYFGEYRQFDIVRALLGRVPQPLIRSGATGCIATTTRITRCSQQNGPPIRSSTAAGKGPNLGYQRRRELSRGKRTGLIHRHPLTKFVALCPCASQPPLSGDGSMSSEVGHNDNINCIFSDLGPQVQAGTALA